ncbi:MAG: YidC/Oxa1 family membrane protein insertase [Lachnospiraceae bacterium]|nr:YidC/Oxa1 family membrane protein insertase [Lachnospiraceae bacterium]MBQ7782259.1 YidC/Oxa1 family membrane protein insertase [Lachnospiraceae bacterium]
MNAIVDGLVWLINGCYAVCHNYWIAILIFTFLTKVILLPLSVWVQKNSIKTVRMQPEINRIKAKYWGNNDKISEEQYKLFKREKYSPFVDLIPLFVQLALLMGVVEAVKKGTDLTAVPIEVLGITLLVPVIAALSAFFMCYVQNKINVLQAEQGAFNKYGTLIFSVALSLYLGFFVSIGVGVYWIYSNVLSVVQLVLLNIWINPKKYIDYEALEASKEELKKAKQFMTPKKKEERSKECRKKEKEDYKKFLSGPKKRLVFYSERNGFYKYYKNIIEEIIRRTNIVVHYITSDPEDAVFALESEQFKPYYIGDNKMIVLMMKMETDIMVMTTPDLENFQLKRSYVKKDIEYIYVPHDVNSSNLTFHKNALDHFDTIFASGYKNKEEIQEREKQYNLPAKNIVEWGSCVIDDMTEAYAKMQEEEQQVQDKKTILIAPSWQKDNIMDSCIENLLDSLKGLNYRIVVRPHPQYVRHFEARIDSLIQKYGPGVEIQKDFSSNRTVYMADLLVTDWSSIAFEYAFSTLKPVLFINTPMKVVNEDYKELKTVPIDIELRDKVGISIEEDETAKLPEAVEELLYAEKFSKEAMKQLRDSYIYNVGNSGKIGAKYIIQRLVEKTHKK